MCLDFKYPATDYSTSMADIKRRPWPWEEEDGAGIHPSIVMGHGLTGARRVCRDPPYAPSIQDCPPFAEKMHMHASRPELQAESGLLSMAFDVLFAVSGMTSGHIVTL